MLLLILDYRMNTICGVMHTTNSLLSDITSHLGRIEKIQSLWLTTFNVLLIAAI